MGEKWLIDERELVVKKLFENKQFINEFIDEVEILTRLRHRNLVTLYDCTSRHSRELLLVYGFISNGTVADHLHKDGAKPKSSSLFWPIRLNIAIETATALTYLHATKIVHRDVKKNNILLDNSFCVKVADFGISRLFPADATHVSAIPQGTPGYLDPAYFVCVQLTEKSDVYSFEIVFLELISSLPALDRAWVPHQEKGTMPTMEQVLEPLRQISSSSGPSGSTIEMCVISRPLLSLESDDTVLLKNKNLMATTASSEITLARQ